MTEQLSQEISNLETTLGILSLIMGMAFSILGGFICALMAKVRWHKAVLILAGVMSLYGVVIGAQHMPIGKTVILTLLTFGSIYVGGWLRGRRLSVQ